MLKHRGTAIIETPRLIIRQFTTDDAEAMFRNWANDPEVTKYLTWNAHEDVEISKMIVGQWVEQYEKPERLNFAIVLKENGKLIGGIDVVGYLDGVPVIGYAMSRAHWGKGLMTEACSALLTQLFTMGYSEAYIDAQVENIGSNRVIQKCGGVLLSTEACHRPMKNDTVMINRYVVRRPQ